MAKDGEPEYKNQRKILYYVHYTIDPVYSHPITTNFRNHLTNTHKIIIKEDESSLQSKVTTVFNKLLKKADVLGCTTEIQNKVFQTYP